MTAHIVECVSASTAPMRRIVKGSSMLQHVEGTELRRQTNEALERKRRFANLKPRVVIPIQNLDVPVTIEPTVIPQKWNWGDCSFKRYEYPGLKEIMATVAAYYHIEVSDIQSHRRTACLVRPRQVYFYLARKMTPRSFPEISRECGDRDHTTTLHGARKIEDLVTAGDKVMDDIDILKARITRRLAVKNGNRMEAVEILGA